MGTSMRARVYVSLKPTVLDPQGATIRSALVGLGYTMISDVRQGKYFDINLADGVDRERAATELEEISREVLSNPVIENFQIEVIE
jgi:phosphoribosylformylglycinamidine synthase PurS subunit